MKHENVALLGATGFLGQQVLIDLVGSGYKVTVILQSTSTNTIPFPVTVTVLTLKQFLSCDTEFDFMINCAGYYSKSAKFSEIYRIRKSNYVLVKQLTKVRKKKGGSLITFGSYFEKSPPWKEIPAYHYTKYKIKVKKFLKISAKTISFPTFYIYLFDTYGEGDNRNKVLTFIIREFKHGRIPDLTNPLEHINWSHKSDISASVIKLMKNSERYLPYKLYEFQIRSPDEFRLIDFVQTISELINLKRIRYYKDSNFGNLYDCAQNMTYFKAKSNVIEFTLNSIKLKNEVL